LRKLCRLNFGPIEQTDPDIAVSAFNNVDFVRPLQLDLKSRRTKRLGYLAAPNALSKE
jgi:hypothetical protein